MQFFTKVSISESQKPIDYNSKIVSIGSCFATNMGEKLEFYKFPSTTNPFGIIFNPISIEKLICRAVQKKLFTEKDIFFHNERWHSFEIHSELSHPDQAIFLNNLNEKLELFFKKIATATHFIITLGTSWVYKTIQTNEMVANCHKIPQKQFTKHLLSTSEISDSIKNISKLVLTINPDCEFIFTVSPVRHKKDGFIENQVSKAHLIAAIYETNTQNSHYFPSYEIMMDELRDYRFYSEDLLHPNTTAIDYIWSRFVETNINPASFSTMEKVKNIQKGLQHRAYNSNSISHQKFLQNLEERIKNIGKSFPFMKF